MTGTAPSAAMSDTNRDLLIEICRRVDARGLVVATDGNLSMRLPDGTVLTTPSGVNKGRVTADDLVTVTMEGRTVAGRRAPSTELLMHLFIYRHRPDVNAVVHCHPVHATAFAAAHRPLTPNVFPEVVVQFGDIPLAEYAAPSTPALGESLAPFVRDHNAVLLANHGAVTYGTDLWDAYYRMEKVEQTAHMLYAAEALGGAKPLPAEQVERLRELATTVYGR
ncbi:MAG: class II aldolase/adducin family protein [Bacteroidetes bacterium]|nr:MAG: class II aldolase/adducin family protein [Bacteroidota bacterium]